MDTKLNIAEADALIEMPLVTVYMPTHNRVELLQRAVESVLTQTYKNIELIVVDDKSTDSTPEYLEAISKKDPRVRFFRNEENSGACVSRNKAIFAAKGEFITGLDDDDYFLPNHLLFFLKEWANKSSQAIALYSNMIVKSKSGMRQTTKLKKCNAKMLIHANWIGNQVFTRTKYLKDYGGFDPRFPAWQDLECWYGLLIEKNGIAVNTNKHTYVHDTSHPHERISNKKIEKIIEAFELYCEKYSFNKKERSVASLMLLLYEPKIPNIFSILNKIIILPKTYVLRQVASIYYHQLKFFIKNNFRS